MNILQTFEDKTLTVSRKRLLGYSLILSYGVFLFWTTGLALTSDINSIINYPSLYPLEEMDYIIPKTYFVEQIIFRDLPLLFAGLSFIISYFGYIFSKSYARITGIFGGMIYLIYPMYYYSNYEGSSYYLTLVYFFLPTFLIISLTIKYWDIIEENKEIKNKAKSITLKIGQSTLYSLLLSLGIISFIYFFPFSIGRIAPTEVCFSVSTILLFISYYSFVHSEKYSRYAGILGCGLYIIAIIGRYYDILSIPTTYLTYHLIFPCILVILIIYYWKKLNPEITA